MKRYAGRRSLRRTRRSRRVKSRRVKPLRSARRGYQSTSRRLGGRAFVGRGSTDTTVTTRFEYRASDVKNGNGASGNSSQFFTYYLNAAGAPALAPYISRYEYYRIDSITVRFSPGQQKPIASSTAPSPPPEFYTFIDRSLAGSTINNEQAVYSLANRQAHSPWSTSYVTFRPNTLQYAYGGNTVTPTYVPMYGQWWPTTDGTAPHFGMRTFTVGNDLACTWGVHVSMKVSFKGIQIVTG